MSIKEIQQRWGTTREDFDWSLRGDAIHGEQAVTDIRALLAENTRLREVLEEISENAGCWGYNAAEVAHNALNKKG